MRVTVAPISTEEAILIAALSRLVAAVHSENFHRTGRREMTQNLRAALRKSESLLALYAKQERA